jgi:hypothetical protein
MSLQEKEEAMEHLEDMNQTLIVKERECNEELHKPLQSSCKRKYSSDVATNLR